MRLVQDSATAETEPLTIVHSLTDATGATPETLNVLKKVLLDQSAVSSATVQTQAVSRAPMIEVVLTEKGRKAFADITRQSVGKRLAMVVDGKLPAAPRIETEIPGGRALITGRFSTREASELATKINDGVKK
jgi:SecD/SecF fusion protein